MSVFSSLSEDLNIVKGYLSSVGHAIDDIEDATAREIQLFATEVSNNCSMTKVAVLNAIGNFELFTSDAIAHIEKALGVVKAPVDEETPVADAVDSLPVAAQETPTMPVSQIAAAPVEPVSYAGAEAPVEPVSDAGAAQGQ